MSKRIAQILLIYLRHPVFMLLAGILVAGDFIAKTSLRFGIWDVAEDMWTLMFVMITWLAFVFGVLIKRQFANHRASLMPRHRPSHMLAAVMVYAVFIGILSICRSGLVPNFQITPQEFAGIYMTCLFVSLLIIYLGYLSIAGILFMAYFALLVVAGQTSQVIAFLGISEMTRIVMGGSSFLLAALIVQRLLRIKEDSFEYPFLMAWPQKDLIRNQMRLTQVLTGWVESVAERCGIKSRPAALPAYPAGAGFLSRMLHWDRIEREEVKIVLVLLALTTPLYLQFIEHFSGLHKFYKSPYTNFLLYSIAPVLIAVCGRYKQAAYLGYDLLKPVRKTRFLLERGALLSMDFACYWLLFAVYFALLPAKILSPDLLTAWKLWAFLLLAGGFGFFSLQWIVYMAALTSPKKVIFNGLFSCALTQVEFMLVPHLAADDMVIHAIVWLIGATWFQKLGYDRWKGGEF
ncbi:MAG: hypothetical protein Q8Q08_05540 [Candidatus Omnitrophota bacterium]|nr:hypothetical protein [Candidatus Omnitrophota bacterium]MDZ4242507.1 hypothetical protein [Candidatus Omnitrophota bacterium]